MPITPEYLQNARKEGFTDDEIYSYEATQDPFYAKAKEEGFTLDELAQYNATVSAPDEDTLADDWSGFVANMRIAGNRLAQGTAGTAVDSLMRMKEQADKTSEKAQSFGTPDANPSDYTPSQWMVSRGASMPEGSLPRRKYEEEKKRLEEEAGTLQQQFQRGAMELPEFAQYIAQKEKRIQELQPSLSPEMKKLNESEGSEFWKTFATNPVESLANVIGSSMVVGAPAITGGLLGGGAGFAGTALGAGLGSYSTEVSQSILDSMREQGVDMTNPNEISKAFSNPAVMEDARGKAETRGVAVAAFDSLTAGLAGRFIGPVIKETAPATFSVLKASAEEAGMQMAGGATGETIAQVISGEKLSTKDIALEALGEIGSGVTETISNLRQSGAPLTAQALETETKGGETDEQNETERIPDSAGTLQAGDAQRETERGGEVLSSPGVQSPESSVQPSGEGGPRTDVPNREEVLTTEGEVPAPAPVSTSEPVEVPQQQESPTPQEPPKVLTPDERATALQPHLTSAIAAAKASGAPGPEDAAQVAWIKVSNSEKPLDNPRAVLVDAARSEAKSQLSKANAQKRGGGLVEGMDVADLENQAVQTRGPRAEAISKEDMAGITKAISTLNANEKRVAMVRARGEEMTAAEVAEELDLAEGTVRNIDMKLKELLKPYAKTMGYGQSIAPGAASIAEVLVQYEVRRFSERFQKSKDIDEDVREQTGNRYYEVLPNQVTAEKAREFFEQNPDTEKAISIVMDEKQSVSFADRAAIGQLLVKKINEERKALKETDPEKADRLLDRVIEASEWLAEYGTRLGQGVQAFAMWNRLTPEGKLRSVQKEVQKTRRKHKAENKPKVEQIISALNEASKAAAKKVAASSRVKKARTKKDSEGPVSLKDVWGEYEKSAIKNLEAALFGGKAKSTPALQEFTSRLVSALRSKLPKKEGAPTKLSDEQVVREAVTNFDKYKQVWQDTANAMKLRYGSQPDVLLKLDEVFGPAFKEPFSRQTIRNLISKKLKEDDVKLSELIEKHYSNTESASRDLAEKISASIGVPKEQADLIASAVEQEFASMVTKEKASALAKLVKTNPVAKKAKSGFEKLIAASNKGALNDQTFYDAVSESLGLPAYTKESAAEIMRLAEIAENAAEGMPKEDALNELNSYIAHIKGFHWSDLPLGIYYGNILSGAGTQVVNLVDTALNVVSEVAGSAIVGNGSKQSLSDAFGMISGLARGLDSGRWDWLLSITKGRRISDGKFVENPYLMDIARFGEEGGVPIQQTGRISSFAKKAAESKYAKYLKGYKYVGRVMAASDALAFRSAQEARAAQLAHWLAYDSGLKGQALRDEVDRILGFDRKEEFLEQAEAEGYTGATAKARATELMLQSRPEGLQKEATQFASEATYNYKPEGMMGAISNAIEGFSRSHPAVKLIVPFTRIVANVTNRGLNYTPWGAFRAWRMDSDGKTLTDQERRKQQMLYTRAVMGVSAMSVIGAMAAMGFIKLHGKGPDDDEKRKQLRETGWKPYTIQIGNQYFTYTYTPIGLGLAALANSLEAKRYGTLEDKDIYTAFAYAIQSIGSTIFSQSFLSNLSSFFEALSNRGSQGVSAFKRLISSTASGLAVPFSSAVKDVNQLFDPKVRKPENIKEALISEIPVARLAVRPAINALGEPIEKDRIRLRERFMSSNREGVWKMVRETGLRIPTTGPFFMNPKEDYEYAKKTGERIKGYLERNEKFLRSKSREDAQDSLENFADRVKKEVRGEMLYKGAKKKPKK